MPFAKTRLALMLAPLLLLAACTGADKEDPTPTAAVPVETATTAPQAPAATQTPAPGPGPAATAAPSSLTALPAATQAAASTPSSGVLAELEAAVRASNSIRSFKADITIEEPGQAKQAGTISFVQPDRMQIVFSSSGQQVELIVIGKDAYIKFGGSWSKLPAGTDSQPFDFSEFNAWLSAYGTTIGAEKGGTDTVAGKRCQIYTVTSNQTRDSVEYCIADNRFLRIIAKSSGSATTLVFTEVNTNIDIRAPI